MLSDQMRYPYIYPITGSSRAALPTKEALTCLSAQLMTACGMHTERIAEQIIHRYSSGGKAELSSN